MEETTVSDLPSDSLDEPIEPSHLPEGREDNRESFEQKTKEGERCKKCDTDRSKIPTSSEVPHKRNVAQSSQGVQKKSDTLEATVSRKNSSCRINVRKVSNTFQSPGPRGFTPRMPKRSPSIVMEEMRRYYEGEIDVLKKQLTELTVENQPSDEALIKKCCLLESQLRRAQNEADSLSEQVAGMKTQIATWPNRVVQLEDENNTLRDKIDDLRQTNRQRQQEIDDLQVMVRSLEKKLWEKTNAPKHDRIILQRMITEYDNLVKDYEISKKELLDTQKRLTDAERKVTDTSCRISHLQAENRRLCTENADINLQNRLYSRNMSSVQEENYSSTLYATPASDQRRNVRSPMSDIMHGSSVERQSNDNEIDKIMSMMSMSCYGSLPSERVVKRNSSATEKRLSVAGIPMNAATEASNTAETNRRLFTRSQIFSGDIDTESAMYRSVTTDNRYNLDEGRREHDYLRTTNQEYGSAQMVSSNKAEMIKKYDDMQVEKRFLESKLTHLPTLSSSRNRKQVREQRETIEDRLDNINRNLGSLRKNLRQMNVFK